MFVTRKHLTRRTVLRGLGATIGLPLLDERASARRDRDGSARARREAALSLLMTT